jgi:hypothetical protein
VRDLFDQRLTDPTADAVADALRACVAAANTQSDGDLVAFDADAVATQVLGERSGFAWLFGGDPETPGAVDQIARLAVAWWTNPAGRKLVRVRGRREADSGDRPGPLGYDESPTPEHDRAQRPPIWHLEPERVVEAFTAGDPEWVAVCGCGAAGSAESLGWSHGMCGPCADRVAEYGADAVRHEPGLLAADGFEPRDVVFTGDGEFVVACGSDQLHVWHTATGAPHQSTSYSHYADDHILGSRLFTSPTGRSVLTTEDGILTPAESRIEYPFSFDLEARAAYWTGRPNELLVQSTEGNLYLANAYDGHAPELARPIHRDARLLALHPHSERPRAVFAWNGNAAVVRVRDDGTLIEEWRFLLGNGRLDRTGMWSGGPTLARFTPDGERILFVRGTEVELWLPSRSKALQQVEWAKPVLDAQFSPDGEFAYLLTDDGTIHVCPVGALNRPRARLRWHVGGATRLAIAPDGRTLATAGAEGVKLWPVASLLPLLD